VKAFASLQGKAFEPLRGATGEQLRGGKVATAKERRKKKIIFLAKFSLPAVTFFTFESLTKGY